MNLWNDWNFATIIVLGLIQGITELLPISSTGHLLILEKLVGFSLINMEVLVTTIQFGSVLSIICFFRTDLYSLISGIFQLSKKELKIFALLIVSFIPIVFVGTFFIKLVKFIYFPEIVGIFLIFGGLIILKIEGKKSELVNQFKYKTSLQDISFKKALIVGLSQCLAIIPGFSRSGVTIFSGMMLGLHRKIATKFSFFLAIPTIAASASYSLFCNFSTLSISDISSIFIGILSSFFGSILIIERIFKFLETHTYRIFAIYRLVLGVIVLTTTLLMHFN